MPDLTNFEQAKHRIEALEVRTQKLMEEIDKNDTKVGGLSRYAMMCGECKAHIEKLDNIMQMFQLKMVMTNENSK